MSDTPPLFLPANFFLVRAASLPIDCLFALLKEENPKTVLLEKWLKDPFFRQALAFSSQSLSREIRKGKISEGVIRSLFKYFSRMSSRGTPYGLLSFVTWGEVHDHATSYLDCSLLAKRARPDMGWLKKYTEILFTDDSEFLNFEVQRNPVIICRNDRYITNYFVDKTDRTSASIKKNRLTSLIFSHTFSSISIKALICLIEKNLPILERAKIIDAIKLLLAEQFLWHTFYPKLSSSNPIEESIKSIPQKYSGELSSFNEQIENYNRLDFRVGEQYLYQLIDQMAERAASSRLPVQVDLAIPSKQLGLPEAVLNHVAKVGAILWKLGRLKSKHSSLKSYHTKFLGKYGQYRLVPLLDVLDSTKGLGSPDYESSLFPQPIDHQQASPYYGWLGAALSKALKDRQHEILLDDETVAHFVKEIDQTAACYSADLFFEIYADSADAVTAGNYLICITNFINRGGVTFGRFIDMLDAEVAERLERFYFNESMLGKGMKILESFYLPQNSNAQNVAISPPFRVDKIDLLPGGRSTINLDEIYVGATNECLYLTDAKGAVEFRVTSTNALVDLQAPDVLRFMREISEARTLPIEPWSWGPYSHLTYLPRVRYEKTILSPAKWKTTLSLLGLQQKSQVEEIVERLSNWFIDFEVPEYIYITERDNRLLIKKSYPEHLRIAAAYLKKEGEILFSEKIGQEQGQWIESVQGRHSVEYVLPLLKNPFYAQDSHTALQGSYNDYPLSDRWKLPGSEWLYCKFYLPPTSHSLFLRSYLSPFAEKLTDEKLIDQWFFIRFEEGGNHHIRFRVKISAKNAFPLLLNLVSEFSQHLLEISLIQNMSIDSYEREIERYGGEALINSCEELFCVDSSLVVALLEFESNELPIHVIGAISVLDILQNLQLDPQQISAFFHNMRLDKKGLKGYREWKKQIEKGFNMTFGPIGEKRACVLRQLASEMGNSPVDHRSPLLRFCLASSLVHMHCNRLAGVDPMIENKIKVFAAHYTESYTERGPKPTFEPRSVYIETS